MYLLINIVLNIELDDYFGLFLYNIDFFYLFYLNLKIEDGYYKCVKVNLDLCFIFVDRGCFKKII